jgi:hypothetical protein
LSSNVLIAFPNIVLSDLHVGSEITPPLVPKLRMRL